MPLLAPPTLDEAEETSNPRGRGLDSRPLVQLSAGGLVVRGGKILLIRAGDRWQLPKGRIEQGETAAEAAVREVWEETGVEGSLLGPLSCVDYSFVRQDGRLIHKQVQYFLMEYVEGEIAPENSPGVSGAAWLSWLAGFETLSYDNERQIVGASRELYRVLRRRAAQERRKTQDGREIPCVP